MWCKCNSFQKRQWKEHSALGAEVRVGRAPEWEYLWTDATGTATALAPQAQPRIHSCWLIMRDNIWFFLNNWCQLYIFNNIMQYIVIQHKYQSTNMLNCEEQNMTCRLVFKYVFNYHTDDIHIILFFFFSQMGLCGKSVCFFFFVMYFMDDGHISCMNIMKGHTFL